jgi:hypothetical protein
MHTRNLAAPLVLVTAIVVSGCGRPQVEPKNLHLIASLRTALSARNAEWLEQNANIIEQRHRAGEMSAEQYAEFQAILQDARAGDWAGAEKDAVAFQKAQRPTEQQMERVRQHGE